MSLPGKGKKKGMTYCLVSLNLEVNLTYRWRSLGWNRKKKKKEGTSLLTYYVPGMELRQLYFLYSLRSLVPFYHFKNYFKKPRLKEMRNLPKVTQEVGGKLHQDPHWWELRLAVGGATGSADSCLWPPPRSIQCLSILSA